MAFSHYSAPKAVAKKFVHACTLQFQNDPKTELGVSLNLAKILDWFWSAIPLTIQAPPHKKSLFDRNWLWFDLWFSAGVLGKVRNPQHIIHHGGRCLKLLILIRTTEVSIAIDYTRKCRSLVPVAISNNEPSILSCQKKKNMFSPSCKIHFLLVWIQGGEHRPYVLWRIEV